MQTHSDSLRKPPSVPRWISIRRAAKFVSNPIPILDENLDTYGPTFRFHIGGMQPGMVTVDPTIIQHILQKNHRNYRKSRIQTGVLAHYVGQGLLTSEGTYWLRQRRLIQPGFHRDRLASLVALMNTEIDDYVKKLHEKIVTNPTINISEDMHRLAFRIVAKTLFSTSVTESELNKLSEQISALQAFIIKQIRQPFSQWWFRISGQIKKHEHLAEETKAVITRLIRDRIHSRNRPDDLLQMLLDSRYEDGSSMTEQQVLDESLILFVAGHETSANALAWTFYLLAQHPEVVIELQSEIAHHLKGGIPHFSQLKNLPYTTQIIQESMRLYPPAWIIDRVAIDHDQVAGYKIDKGTMMLLYVYGAHRNPNFWDQPSTFDPGRFASEHKKNIPPYTYFPFGGGPRMCIGNNFAMMEMQLIVARMIQRFNLKKIDPEEIGLMPMVTLRPSNEMLCIVSER